MIELLTGDNDFELTRAIKQRKAKFDGRAERFDAETLDTNQLADIFTGQTLFAIKRLVIIDTPSLNADLWNNLETWLGRGSDDISVVLVEPKLDKRTSAYKWLMKNVDVKTFTAWTPRDRGLAEEWTLQYAKQQGVKLTTKHARHLVERAGLDPWALHHAIDKLSLLDDITDDAIDDIVPHRREENVFVLLETALSADTVRLQDMLEVLRQTEDAYRVFGLLTSQVLQLTLLVHAEGSIKKVVQDTGARPFMLERLAPQAARLTKTDVKHMIQLFAAGDTRLKSSDADPWTVIETTLLQIKKI